MAMRNKKLINLWTFVIAVSFEVSDSRMNEFKMPSFR